MRLRTNIYKAINNVKKSKVLGKSKFLKLGAMAFPDHPFNLNFVAFPPSTLTFYFKQSISAIQLQNRIAI